MGNITANSANLAGGVVRQPGIAISGAAQTGIAGLDYIDVGQLCDWERRMDDPLDAKRSRSHADTDPPAKYRIGQDCDAVDLQEHGAVADPGGV